MEDPEFHDIKYDTYQNVKFFKMDQGEGSLDKQLAYMKRELYTMLLMEKEKLPLHEQAEIKIDYRRKLDEIHKEIRYNEA